MSNAPRTPRYVQVNIGRNVPTVMPDGSLDPRGEQRPMPDERWVSFQDDIAMAIVNATTGTLPNVSLHEGEGFWNDERTGELLSEESAYLSTFADVDLFALRKALATLKRRYQQDAIALIVGSDLI